MSITIIVPTYNEEKRLEKTLSDTIPFLKKNFNDYEIIVADDSSTDKTISIASKFSKHGCRVMRSDYRRGKGFSVRQGMLAAKKDYVLFMDSDMATPIEELTRFMKYAHEYDIVIASRNLKESKIQVFQPKSRQFMGKLFPLLIRIFILRGFRDTQCGFKLFRTHVAKEIASLQTIEGFAFDVEILYIAKKKGFKIKEAPVTWIDKEGSKVSVVKDGIKMLKDSFRVLLNNINGKYD